MSGTILSGRGVCRTFGALKAVWKLDFSVQENEILGIIGPNGAGKTTLLYIINGILPVNTGEIIFRKKRITGLKSHEIAELGISSTFQIVKPFPGMTALENVAIGALFGKQKISDVKRAQEKAKSILAKVGMGEKTNVPVENLTVSEIKRLELARALAMDPEILLLDEVMAGLNQSEIELTMELIQEVNREGKTILVIEHVMKAIMGISHRILVLHHGEKIAEGTPQDISTSDKVISAYLGERYAQKWAKNVESK